MSGLLCDLCQLLVNDFTYYPNLKSRVSLFKHLMSFFQAIIISRIEYALPCFSGFLSEANIGQINAALRKARKWGLTDLNVTLENIADQSDIGLFN